MSDTNLSNSAAQNVPVDTSDAWHKEAQRTVKKIAKLKRILRFKLSQLARLPKAQTAGQRSKCIRQKQELRKGYNRPRHHYRSERHFFYGKDNRISVANGTSALQHCFEEDYTGAGMHQSILTELADTGSRFDFRARHELLGKVFEHYAAGDYPGLDLPSKIKKLGLIIMERDLKHREAMLAHLEQLFRLDKGAEIYFFVETGNESKEQVARRFRHILFVVFSLLERLHLAGYQVKLVVNPAYVASDVKNGDHCSFSVASGGNGRYEMSAGNATFSVKGFEQRLLQYFEEYGEQWSSRVPALS
ncbi:hypothetical protein BDW02DRAFT_602202 [Decorospora gaudefroyi]|uniref:Uncharacterized protein n=1 Tax=Decorospora gaudefroyi TaxID=184978 RepID=A0A6A5K1B5_9PLEO|nr:hypothetical protein BDW02DRAFT_602202 [Decorospora gaudefroyi]